MYAVIDFVLLVLVASAVVLGLETARQHGVKWVGAIDEWLRRRLE